MTCKWRKHNFSVILISLTFILTTQVSCCFLCCNLIAVVLKICDYVTQLWREIEAEHFQHARTGSLTCCLATDCNNPQFTLRQLPLKHRLSGENCRCMIYRWIVCLCGRFASHAVCIHLQNSVVFVCGRLFELDPELLTLFHYTTNCGSTQDCLSSPEFLEHVTKVSSVHRSHHYEYTVCTTV